MRLLVLAAVGACAHSPAQTTCPDRASPMAPVPDEITRRCHELLDAYDHGVISKVEPALSV